MGGENKDPRNDQVTWRMVALLAAGAVPLLVAAMGYGVLYQRVDTIGETTVNLQRHQDKTDMLLNDLSVSIAKLSVSVDNLVLQQDKK